MNIIDTHAHLDHIDNLDESLTRAAEAGVESIVGVSVGLDSCRKNLEIKKNFSSPNIHAALGIHPGEIKLDEIDDCLRFIRDSIKEAIAVGETGLDYWYKWVKKDEAKKREQREIFARHLELGKEFDLPVIIHSRGAWRDCFEMTKAAGVRRAEFHWYSGPLDVLKDILDQGYFVSTTPSLAYSPQSREAISAAPIEQTLIETDCPVHYKHEGSDEKYSARPKDVFATLKAYCHLKNIDQDKALEQFNTNARSFFNL
jgi:TatD DNase family protein